MTTIANALTIAGSDSGGGAGIQADLKSFSANGVYGASILAALTAQNTKGVTAIHDVPVDFVTAQMDAVFDDIEIHAVKIGMLSCCPVIEAVVSGLKKHNAQNIVLDPVMVATSGDLLLDEDAIEAVLTELVPLAGLITPNLHEAAKLTSTELAATEADMVQQAEKLLKCGAKAVLIKGGHGSSDEAADLLLTEGGEKWFRARRINSPNMHGTGCSLSSAIAAWLARGETLERAIGKAKVWLTGAIEHSHELNVGQGAGPVHHFFELWRN